MKIKNTTAAPLLCLAVYALLLLSRLTDGVLPSQGAAAWLSVAVMQILIMIIPGILYINLRGKAVAGRLRFSLFGADKIIVVILTSLALAGFSLFYETALSAAGSGGASFSLYGQYTAPAGTGFANALYSAVTFAFLPAVCEEFIFRSVLTAEYEKSGVLCCAVITSLLFAGLHFSGEKFILYFVCGLLLFLCTYACRSVFAAMAAHFIYNLFCLFGQGLLSSLFSLLSSLVLVLFIAAVFTLIVLALLFSELARIYRSYSKQNKPSDYLPQEGQGGISGLWHALVSPPLLICLLVVLIVILA